MAVLVGCWIIAYGWDYSFSNRDGIVSGVNTTVLLDHLTGWVSVFTLALLGMKSRHTWLANGSLSLFSVVVFWVLAELVCFGLIRSGWVEAPLPFHSRLILNRNWLSTSRPFWADLNPDFGRWRVNNDSLISIPCHGKAIRLSSNGFGMRDKPRTLRNSGSHKRVLLLGDSFVEGYVVEVAQRYSNLLEAATGSEHLNFGINGTSPINYFLIYKHLASRFEHDVVVVSLLPANDFEDYTENQKLELLRYPIYRPYWRGEFPHVTLAYSLANINQSVAALPNHNKPARVQQTVDSLYHTLPFGQKILAEIKMNSYVYSCVYYWAARQVRQGAQKSNSFSSEAFESRWPAFAYSLKQLLTDARAGGKKVFVLGMPILSDLEAYGKDHQDNLSPLLRKICRESGADYINFLPLMYRQGQKAWSGYYVACDGHFSPAGEKFVADQLLKNPTYRHALLLDATARPHP